MNKLVNDPRRLVAVMEEFHLIMAEEGVASTTAMTIVTAVGMAATTEAMVVEVVVAVVVVDTTTGVVAEATTIKEAAATTTTMEVAEVTTIRAGTEDHLHHKVANTVCCLQTSELFHRISPHKQPSTLVQMALHCLHLHPLPVGFLNNKPLTGKEATTMAVATTGMDTTVMETMEGRVVVIKGADVAEAATEDTEPHVVAS